MSERPDFGSFSCVRCGRINDQPEKLSCKACSAEKPPSAFACATCGEEIPEERRLAAPGCTRCVKCQDAFEKRNPDDGLAGVVVYDGKAGGTVMFVKQGQVSLWRRRDRRSG